MPVSTRSHGQAGILGVYNQKLIESIEHRTTEQETTNKCPASKSTSKRPLGKNAAAAIKFFNKKDCGWPEPFLPLLFSALFGVRTLAVCGLQ